MAHVEPAHLVELALGNATSGDDARALRHVAVCVRCRDELNRLTRVVAVARAVEASDMPASPPEQVWGRIARESSRTEETATSPASAAAPRTHAATAGERDTGRAGHSAAGAIRLVAGLLAGAAVIQRIRRARTARQTDQGD
ncbi:hypothetical protein [Streptomyces sp. MN13]